MIRCSLKPYEGKEKYIFISYAHKDSSRVYPIIETLASMGYRIWYDEGIDPGSEWPETIAEHLNGCEVCLAFLSSDYLESQNCRRELNFTLRKKKSFITVVLEPVELSLGMEMQLSTTQSVSKYSFPKEEVFYEKLCSTKFLSECRISEPLQPENENSEARREAPSDAEKPKAEAKREAPSDADGRHIRKIPRRNASAPKESPAASGPTKDKAVLKKLLAKGKPSKPLIAAIGLAVLLLMILLIRLAAPTARSITIAGKSIKPGETSVSLSQINITGDDIKSLSSLKNLKYLQFSRCGFEEGAAAGLGSLSETVISLTFSECTGIEDYSAVSQLAALSTLTIKSCGLTDNQLSAIVFGDSFKSIDLSGNGDLSDLTPLNGAENMWKLVADGTSVTDFKALSECGHLQTLSASGNGIQDISSLAGVSVTYLTLENNQIRDLSPLAGNDRMEKLILNGNQVTDISPLRDMVNLVSLQINDNSVTSLAPLSACTKLSVLQANRNQLTDLKGLEHALKLQEIIAAGNHLTDLSGLENCTILARVNLAENALQNISLLQKSLASLQKVCLDKNQLTDINALRGAVALEYLSVDDNMLTTLEPLAESSSLITLSARNNRLTSLKGLENAVKLSRLWLAHNQIEDAEILSSLTENREEDYYVLDLRDNDLQTLKLNDKIKYRYLAIYGNSFASLDFLNGLKGTCLYFDYMDEIGEESFTPSFYKYEIVGCPLDKQVATKAALKGTINFSTAEELEDAIVEQTRD